MPHAVALGKQGVVEHRGRHIFKKIRAIGIGRAVQIGGTDALHRIDVGMVEIVAAAKHQVFEQMREPGLAELFVFGADVVPGIDRDHRRLVIFMHQQGQAVFQHEFGIGNVRNGDIDFAGSRFGRLASGDNLAAWRRLRHRRRLSERSQRKNGS